MLEIKEIVKLILLNNIYIYIYEMLPILIGLYMNMQKKEKIELNIVPSLNWLIST